MSERAREWSERLVLWTWRWFPRHSRERHRDEIAATLADLRAADPQPAHRSPRMPAAPADREPASTGSAPGADPASGASRRLSGPWLVLDAVLTLVRAWTFEVGRRLRRSSGEANDGRRRDNVRGARMSPLGPQQPGSGHRPPARSMAPVEPLLQDVRHALRLARRAPGFAALTVLTLGLGIGGTTTFFSIAHGVMLRALPYPEPERLVEIREYLIERGIPARGTPGNGASYPDVVDLRRETDVFESIAAVGWGSRLLLGSGAPADVRVGIAEPQLFELLGMAPALGRALRPGDRDAVVLDDAVWRNQFGADPGVVGATISLDREPFVVVGVMPPEFLGGARVWLPLNETTEDDLEDRRSKWAFTVYARLADGVTLEQARAGMRVAGARLAAEYPETNEGWGIWVSPLHAVVVGNAGGTLWLLLGASGVLLLTACANVANLQLARLSGRVRETAVRSALGAGRRRIVQQLMVESLTMGLAGGGAGLLLAVWGVRAFVALSPGGIPRLDEVEVDAVALVFTLLVAVVTSLLFGLVPALRGSGAGPLAALRQKERGTGAGVAARRLRNGLLVAEVGLALVLLAGAGLMVDSYLYLWSYEPGFDPSNVLSFLVTPERARYPEPEHQEAFYVDLYDRLRGLPQVEAVGGISRLPGAGRGGDIGYRFRAEGGTDQEERVSVHPISGEALEALRVPLVAGRPLDPDGARQVLANLAAVGTFWPGASPEDAIGRRVLFNPQDPTPWQEIVGVVGDIRYGGLDPEPRPVVYVPHSWEGFRGARFGGTYVVVRTRADPLSLIPAVREAVWALDDEEPIEQITTLQAALADSMARPRFYAFLFSVFGSLAVALSAAGVFGVAAYGVAQRAREIGVRMALGARPAAVLRLVIGQGMVAVALGVGLGLVASRWLGRFVEGFLYGTTPTDAGTFALVCVALVCVAFVALAIPARRATRVDPVRVLREE